MDVTTPSCDEIEDMLPAYVLGALGALETAAVARHVQACTRHTASLNAYEAVGNGLAAGVPMHDPPSVLRRQLLDSVASRRAPAVRVERRLRLGWALAALAAVAVVAVGAWAVSLQSQIDNQLKVRQALVELAQRPDAHMVPLSADGGSSAKGVLIYAGSEAAIWAVALPRLEGDQVFECWWTGTGQHRASGGSFRSADGVGVWFVSVPEDAEDYNLVGITIEANPDVAEPRGPRVLAGEF